MSGESTARRRLGAAHAVALALVVLSLWAGGAGAHAATDDGGSDGSLSVEVADDTPSPAPSATAPAPAPPRPAPVPPPRTSPSGSSTTSPATSVAMQATIPDVPTADDALGDDAVVVDGVLAMSGLSATAAPWIDVGNGSVSVSFVVRNTSPTAYDASAVFWVDSAFGGLIAKTGEIAVDGLQPGETRRVQVVFDGLGQHVVLNAHAVLTPPAEVAGTPAEPISRDLTLLVPPWFSIVLVTGITVLSALGWWAYTRYRQGISVAVPVGGTV